VGIDLQKGSSEPQKKRSKTKEPGNTRGRRGTGRRRDGERQKLRETHWRLRPLLKQKKKEERQKPGGLTSPTWSIITPPSLYQHVIEETWWSVKARPH